MTVVEFKANMKNLTEEERQTLMSLVEKSNKTSKVWEPKEGEWYWCILADTQIVDNSWDSSAYDRKCYSIGNCFCTKEEAQNAVEQLKIRAELQRYADEYNEKIKWNMYRDKWYIVYNHESKNLEVYNACCSQSSFQIYFSSKEIALNAIQVVGEDRIKKYLFGVNN